MIRIHKKATEPRNFYSSKCCLISELQETDFSEPSCYTKAQKSTKWYTTMEEEYKALQRNHTWDLVLYLPSMNIVRQCRLKMDL